MNERKYEDAIYALAENGGGTEADVFHLADKFCLTEQQVEADIAETIVELEGEARAHAIGR